MRKRLISVLLVVCLALAVAACGEDGGKKKETVYELSAPTNLRIIDQGDKGLVHWDAVQYAQSYIVTVNGAEHTTESTSWTIQPLTVDYTVTVVACREGSKNSAAASVSFARHKISVAISGGSECRAGKTLQLTATVSEADDQSVTWKIVGGGEYAKISADGLLTANDVSGDKIVRVRATSVFDSTVHAEKSITITAKPELTQAMLDELDSDKLEFEGFLEIEQWTMDMPIRYMGSVSLGVSTAMDADSWYCEYDDVMMKHRFDYIVDKADVESRPSTACKVSVDLTNTEKSVPVVDGNGGYVAWSDSDYNNALRGLSVSDFKFNESNWRWEYVGSDADARKAKMRAVIASAHTEGFEPKNMYLIVDEGDVAGLYSESVDDFEMYEGYRVRKKLTVAVNVGDAVTVPEIKKFAHSDMHDELQAAIDKMRALSNYTTECLDNSTTMMSGVERNGYVETVTPDVCYMRPFTFRPIQTSLIEIGSGERIFSNADFGYFKCDDNTYNSFKVNDGEFSAYRAYTGSFEKQALPSFDFAAEIFTKSVPNPDGTKTYYADKTMTSVATALYRGLDNEMAIYGIFANQSLRANATLPYVTVGADGYIRSAGFSYYMSAAYGDIKLEYRNFEKATLADDVAQSIETLKASPRTMPDGWDDIEVKMDNTTSTVTALERLKVMFDNDIADRLPYISAAVGDSYTEGATSFRNIVVDGDRTSVPSLILCYAVPFDVDLSINSSLAALNEYLVGNGFAENANGVFIKGDISILPKDDGLRLMLNIWNNSPKKPTA